MRRRLATLFAATLALAVWALPAHACDGRALDSPMVVGAPLCLPAAPARIVVLDPAYNLAAALELGLPVVGAPKFGVQRPEGVAPDTWDAIADIGQGMEPSLEAVIALEPDLILGDAYAREADFAKLARIAPTVLIRTQDWKSYYGLIAEAGGARGRADAGFAAYAARAASIKVRLGGGTLSVVRIVPGGFQVYLDGPAAYGPFSVLREAGVRRPPFETAEDATLLKRVDWEGLLQLQGDTLFYIVGNPRDRSGAAALEAEALANPIWQLLPAVRGNRAFRVDAETWMGFGGLAAANAVLDDVERHLLAAGD